MQHFIQRKYPILQLRGFYDEADFMELCKKNDLDPKVNSYFIKQAKELIQFDDQANIRFYSRKQHIEYEDQMEALIMQKLELNKNPTF